VHHVGIFSMVPAHIRTSCEAVKLWLEKA